MRPFCVPLLRERICRGVLTAVLTVVLAGAVPSALAEDCNENGVPDDQELLVEITQWADEVLDFSTQYDVGDWSAAQALGPPDTFDYGDIETAWTSENYNGTLEFLLLGYARPVYATAVTVRETYGNGMVYQVDLLDTAGSLHTVWTGVDPSPPGSPAEFEVTFPQTPYRVHGVKVRVDTDHDPEAWEEIDAVSLTGLADNDCNDNGSPDDCDIASELDTDRDGNGIPDHCEDCNGNDVPDGLDVAVISSIPFEFDDPDLEWSDSCDDCATDAVALPWPVTLGGTTFAAFEQDSNGYVELLRTSEYPYGSSYGYLADLIASEDLRHTYLLAAYDDLDSNYGDSFFGYEIRSDRVIFYWYTETHCDGAEELYNEFEIVLFSDGRVQWNFNFADFFCYGYDLFSGVYFGHARDELIEIVRDSIPEERSWILTPPTSNDLNRNGLPDECEDCNGNGLPDDLEPVTPFDFDMPDLDWSRSCDDCETGEVGLPWPVTLGAETYTAFEQDSNGYVELLRSGESPYGESYGAVSDLITSGTPPHTFLMAAYDDLYSSSEPGVFGYEVRFDRVVFYWYTETYCDGGDDLFSEFEIVLFSDGRVRWNFNSARYSCFDEDLFTGLYLGHDENELVELARGVIPEEWSRVYPRPDLDKNDNGILDECETGAWLSTATTHSAGPPSGTVHDSVVYRVTADGITLAPHVPAFLTPGVGLDALDAVGEGEFLFSVTRTGMAQGTGASIPVTNGRVYRYRDGVIDTDPGWAALGVVLQSLNALDRMEDGSYLVSVSRSQILNHARRVAYLRPWQVWRLASDELDLWLDAAPLGIDDVDAVDRLPDGRVAISSASDVFTSASMRIWNQNVYATDREAGPAVRVFDGAALGLDDLDAVTLSVTEESPRPRPTSPRRERGTGVRLAAPAYGSCGRR